MELSITTPGLLFPAVSLIMLAHTNRFLALASLIRSLRDRYQQAERKEGILAQIANLRKRLRLIRAMQLYAVVSFLLCAVCMFCIIRGLNDLAEIGFSISILAFIVSLILSLIEIFLSMRALEVELSDLEEYSHLKSGK